ncbi:MAG: hypothetical protein V8Q79_07670 [Christensenellales bacterium]
MDDKTMPTLVLPGEEEEKTPETCSCAHPPPRLFHLPRTRSRACRSSNH